MRAIEKKYNNQPSFDKYEKGYTLIELAISIVVVGLLLAPAFGIYSLYIKDQRFKQTEFSLSQSQNAVGGFRSLYGRYPCPAAPNIPISDPAYGYEDCSLAPIAGNNAIVSDPDVLIGSLPFRELNMEERDSIDGEGARLLYAVTKSMTADTTFHEHNGAITLIDINGDMATTPDHSAHFVILSSNENNDGMYSRDGVLIGGCPVAPALENENCNGDTTFRLGLKRSDFDDRLVSNTPVGTTLWQYSVSDLDDIHLRSADNIALGVNNMVMLSSATPDAEIRLSSGGDAVIRATAGAFYSNFLCSGDGLDCFPSEAIAGSSATVGGLRCPSGPPQEYIVGIENGNVRCESELWFTCPAGQFLSGVNANGELICDTAPLPACAATTTNTRCGDNRPLGGAPDGGFSYAYSGECYNNPNLTPVDTGNIDTQYNGGGLASVRTWIGSNLNTAARWSANQVDCGASGSTDGLVRDTFRCSAGVWSGILHSIERKQSSTWGTFGPFYAGGGHQAETGVAYGPAVDPNNANDNHDCWCREDYRAIEEPCADGYTGDQVRIQKHYCPQTGTPHSWTTVYTGKNECSCAAGPVDVPKACYLHLGLNNWEVNDYVHTITHYKCVAGSAVVDYVENPNPANPATWGCTCPSAPGGVDPKIVVTQNCPAGTANSFPCDMDGDGINDDTCTNVKQLRRQDWHCPNGVGGAVNSVADKGRWNISWPAVPPCTCAPQPDDTREIDCSAHPGYGAQFHGKVQQKRVWLCPSAQWDVWQDVSNTCNACKVRKPAGGPSSTTPYKQGPVINQDDCTCFAPIGTCSEQASPNWDNYTGCSCTP
ncbi:MAG: prepilin-type N-terminal cleavage/methylation domain-containing protein [Rhodospirillales bacterium]|nr:prepilin-type N-terminal cleavage/methylation domain-containing protein [Rhodospirillales bacterium]MCB9995842.1 prepilin-type N-terminal cleavage/methylation domain-containing protein [Rhodospirillales bacterium]